MSKAQPGENVVCFLNSRAEDNLTIGKSYQVLEDEYPINDSYMIMDDRGDEMSYSDKRFMLESEYQELVNKNTKA